MTNLILKILDLFRWFFQLLKVDYKKFRVLLWVKLTMDNRQDKSVMQSKGDKEMSHSMLWVCLIYVFVGIFAGLMLVWFKSLFVSLVFIYALIMFMTAVALVSDFTSVLLDTTDNAILLPRPVESRTIVVTRVTHIVIYLVLITLSLSLASILIGTFRFGFAFTLLFLFTLILSVLFVVFLSTFFYLLLMNISSGERFKDIILYFQIFIAIVAMGSYQILPRLLDLDQIQKVSFAIRWWTYLLAPAWMAAPVDMAVTGNVSQAKIVLSLLAVMVPLISIIVVIRFLAPGFNRAISRLEISGSRAVNRRKKERLFLGMAGGFSRICASNPVEKAVFKMIWWLTSRDRKFRLKTYPSFGYMAIVIVVFVFSGEGNIQQAMFSLPETKKYILFLYMVCFVIPTALIQLRFSDNYEASWIYKALPIAKPGDILKGSLKAVVTKYSLSIFMPISLMVILVWGISVIDDVIFAFLNMIASCTMIAFLVRNEFPFSRKYKGAREAQKGLTGVSMLLIPGVLGVIHFILTFIPYAIYVGIIIMFGIVPLLMRMYSSLSWKSLKIV